MIDRPVRVGFVGAGSVLWAYLQLLDRLIPRGLAVEGPICARHREAWPAILARRPGAKLVVDPLDVVTSDVDIVLIITPAARHAELSRLALEHGKHVLVEKPFAETRMVGDELATLAHERDLHLYAAPFVHLSPTFRALWAEIHDDAIGDVHTARGLYGVVPPEGNTWMREVGPLEDLGIYHLKSLTSLLGPVEEVIAAETVAASVDRTHRDDTSVIPPDVIHVTLRHTSGALSSVVTSWGIQQYRRPALELYGTRGTANLLGDDWDPLGYEVWNAEQASWREYVSLDLTWLWTDGLRELVMAVREDRSPRGNIEQDLHILDVIQAARSAASSRIAAKVSSSFDTLDLRLEPHERPPSHVHDHTRPPKDQ